MAKPLFFSLQLFKLTSHYINIHLYTKLTLTLKSSWTFISSLSLSNQIRIPEMSQNWILRSSWTKQYLYLYYFMYTASHKVSHQDVIFFSKLPKCRAVVLTTGSEITLSCHFVIVIIDAISHLAETETSLQPLFRPLVKNRSPHKLVILSKNISRNECWPAH